MSSLVTRKFWLDAIERAVKTIAQVAISIIGTTAVYLSDVNWTLVASAAVLGGILSILMSIASAGINEKGSASLVE